MAYYNEIPKVRTATWHDVEAEERRRGGGSGGPPDPRRSLWEAFNDKVNDMTHDLRLKARKAIGEEIQRLQAEFQPTLDTAQRARHDAQIDDLSRRFTTVVNGGIKGACVAVNTLRSLKPGSINPS